MQPSFQQVVQWFSVSPGHPFTLKHDTDERGRVRGVRGALGYVETVLIVAV